MLVSEYIAKRLRELGCRHVFMITGGGAMFLNDALAHGLEPVYFHHEQACAIAAEGYARVSTGIPVVNVTTGPGGINALTGVFGAWTDSIPMLVISGQVKQATLMAHYQLTQLRQLGDQEADIIRMASGITKYAALVTDPKSIRYHLERAFITATTGRPGPCWLDIPIDVQSATIDENQLQGYDPDEGIETPEEDLDALCTQAFNLIQQAERPVIMAGTGIHLAQAHGLFDRMCRTLQIPVVTAWTAPDLIGSDDPLFCGRPATVGDRAGNFTVQNADVVLVLGSRLNIRQVSYEWAKFAPNATLIQVDIDPAELCKPTVTPRLGIQADLSEFLSRFNAKLNETNYRPHHADWLAWCKQRVERYPVVLPRHREPRLQDCINPYHFIELLFQHLNAHDIIVCGDGSACVVTYQAAFIQKGMRLFCNSGCAAMGYDLPAAIGAAIAKPGRRIICLAGDGSIQLNIQELQTVAQRQLPIKIFVLNNDGYLSIRQTQKAFFNRLAGESPASGVTFPDMVRLADAYNIPATRYDSAQEFQDTIAQFLAQPGPGVFDIMLDPEQGFEPKVSSRRLADGTIASTALEDMAPFLSPEELRENTSPPSKSHPDPRVAKEAHRL
jgi:acetolactate synthase-1/2/3 large subunit